MRNLRTQYGLLGSEEEKNRGRDEVSKGGSNEVRK